MRHPFRRIYRNELISATWIISWLSSSGQVPRSALGPVAAYLPGVAADGLTQASQAGVHLLAPWQGGLVFTAWAATLAAAGAVMTARRDIT